MKNHPISVDNTVQISPSFKRSKSKNLNLSTSLLKTKQRTNDRFWISSISTVCETYASWIISSLVFLDFILCIGIIYFREYTEIDWSTYMQQIQLIHSGERNYSLIYGDTGPIVYPAGHVWIYYALFFITQQGQHIFTAQRIFALLYACSLYIVLLIYRKCKIPVFMYPLLCISYRLHSIYVLRLFNDPFAMLFLFSSILSLLHKKFTLATVLFSLAVSVKMNILLYAPSFWYLYITFLPPLAFLYQCISFFTLQCLIAFPFLLHAPYAYFTTAFNFKRMFLYQWTVNWKFLSISLFESSSFHVMLLLFWFLGQFFLLLVYSQRFIQGGVIQMIQSWCQHRPAAATALTVVNEPNQSELPLNKELNSTTGSTFNLDSNTFLQQQGATYSFKDPSFPFTTTSWVTLIFLSHLWGILTSRSLHYQFYAWYCWTLPFLLYRMQWNWILGPFIFVFIEYAWTVYPSTFFSSLLLFISHLGLFIGTTYRMFQPKKRQPPEKKVSSFDADHKKIQ